MSSTNYLSSIANLLTRYGMSTYVAFGNIGNLLTIAVFAQREQRRNPCSLYLLAMTICNLICLDVGIIPIIFSLDHIDISTRYLFSCRLQFYIRHASFQMMRTYEVLACIDRYASSSMEVRTRSFSRCKVAVRLIIAGGLFWAIAVIFFSVVRTIQNGSCGIADTLYSLIYTIYYLIFAGILPPFLILVFSILVMRNLKRMRSRVQPTREAGERGPSVKIVRKRDRDLMKMVLIEVMFYVISTMPFSVYLVYKMIADDFVRSEQQKQIESFVNYLAQSFIMYLNTALPFYIYIATSKSFRRELKKVMVRVLASVSGKQIRIADMTQSMSVRQ